MADDLKTNLSNYKLQLQQVEAALALDQENEDLKKLQKDLQEVIQLTEELLKSQATADAAAELSKSQAGSSDQATNAAINPKQHNWKVGDKCIAIWSEDQNHYEATIEEILDDGTCTVTFDAYGNTDVTEVSLLLPVSQGQKRSGEDAGLVKPKTKRDKIAAEREYKKKKAQKKAQRLKQLEEERESEKNKWLDFNAKIFSKTTKGKVKKSIFATPDSVTGRVGVGTCGKSGKPMTQFPQHEKWKK